MLNTLTFTVCEGSAITAALVPKLTVTQRLRGTLRGLLREHGTAAALARYSQGSPVGTRLLPQDISYFINNKPGRNGITLDDLDDIAAFFRLSIGELLGSPRQGELSADEQRLIFAFRALHQPMRDHVIAIVESASIGSALSSRLSDKHGLPAEPASGKTLSLRRETPDGDFVRSSRDTSIDSLRDFASKLSLLLGVFASGGSEPSAIPTAHTEKPQGR